MLVLGSEQVKVGGGTQGSAWGSEPMGVPPGKDRTYDTRYRRRGILCRRGVFWWRYEVK